MDDVLPISLILARAPLPKSILSHSIKVRTVTPIRNAVPAGAVPK
jgi:hypothetical protein